MLNLLRAAACFAVAVGLGLSIITVPAGGASTPPGSSEAAAPAGRIFFVRSKWFQSPPRLKYALHSIDPKGSSLRRLTRFKSGFMSAPVVSPDRTRVAFLRRKDIFKVRADGSRPARLTRDDAVESSPTWSPDSKTIAFERRDPGPDEEAFEIHLLTVKSRESRFLVQGLGPQFSPDGRTLAFERCNPRVGSTSCFDISDFHGISVMDLDTGVVTDVTDGDDSWPTWSPDGDKLAFARHTIDPETQRGQGRQIWRVEVDGTDLRKLADPQDHESADHFRAPRWSPRTNKIAFLLRFDCSPCRRLGGDAEWVMVMNEDGSNQHAVVGTGRNSTFEDWSPNGRRLVVRKRARDGRWRLINVHASGSGRIKLIDSRRTKGLWEFDASWSGRGGSDSFLSF